MHFRAILVVGPHGAGLSNLLFTPPGATVVEVICRPIACYYNTMQVLGHAYVGLKSSSNTKCEGMAIHLEYFEKLVKNILQHQMHQSSKDLCIAK